MLDQQVLRLLGIDVDTATDDEILASIRQVKIALIIEIPEVAESCPAQLVVGFLCLCRILVVGEVGAAFEIDRADLSGGQLVAMIVQDVESAFYRSEPA